MDIETEINELKRRVGELEGAVNSLNGQFARVHPEIVHFRQEIDHRFSESERMMTRIVSRLDTINTQMWGLRDDLPDMLRRVLKSSKDTDGETTGA